MSLIDCPYTRSHQRFNHERTGIGKGYKALPVRALQLGFLPQQTARRPGAHLPEAPPGSKTLPQASAHQVDEALCAGSAESLVRRHAREGPCSSCHSRCAQNWQLNRDRASREGHGHPWMPRCGCATCTSSMCRCRPVRHACADAPGGTPRMASRPRAGHRLARTGPWPRRPRPALAPRMP